VTCRFPRLVTERGAVALSDTPKRSWESLSMPRAARFAPGGMVFHVLSRGVGRMKLFFKEKRLRGL
jgi:hypothetical protein